MATTKVPLRLQYLDLSAKLSTILKAHQIGVAMLIGSTPEALDYDLFQKEFYKKLGQSVKICTMCDLMGIIDDEPSVDITLARVTGDMADKLGATGPQDRAIHAKGDYTLNNDEEQKVLKAMRTAATACGAICKVLLRTLSLAWADERYLSLSVLLVTRKCHNLRGIE